MEMEEDEKGGSMRGYDKAAKLKAVPFKAKVGIGVGCALLVVGVGCGVAMATQQQPDAAQPAAQEQAAEAQKQKANLKVDLGDWDAASSTALIAHVTGDGVDLYTALDDKGQASIELAPGDYELEFVSSIGPDGSILKVSGKQKLKVSDSAASATAKGEKVSAGDVSKDDMAKLVEEIANAVKKGDASLKGDAGKKLIEAAKANAIANPNMDDKAKAEAEAKADEAESDAENTHADQNAKQQGASGGSSGSSSGSGNSSSGSSSNGSAASSQPAHSHNWTPVTAQQWHSNPVSVWVEDSAAWDETKAVFEEHAVCWCGEIDPSRDHAYNHMVNGERSNYSVKSIQVGTTTVHHDATGHYETQDQGWYETVTTGYQCSSCGAWQ